MELTFEAHEHAGLVAVNGSVDALTAPDLAEFINTQFAEGNSNIVVDLSQVEFMSSAGLRALLTALKESRQQGGDLRLAAAPPGVEKVLKMSGFLSIMKSFPGVEEALESFKP